MGFMKNEEDQDNNNVCDIHGSKLYLAPEWLNEKDASNINGEKSDIWALGITFYEILTGRNPFEDAENYQ